MDSEYDDISPINFNNEKDLNNEVENIMNITRDNKEDWKKRESAIKRIGGIVTGNYGNTPSFIKTFNQKLYLNLSIQMLDSRSNLMKEACRIFVLSAKYLNDKIESAVEKIFSPLVIFKLIGSANKVISDTSSNCAFEILKYVHSSKIIQRLAEQTKNKNVTIKIRICQQLIYIISSYSNNLINKSMIIIEEIIYNLTHDANNEVRSNARKIYFRLLKVYPSYAYEIYEKFESYVQKTILEEGKNINNDSDESDTIEVKKSNLKINLNERKYSKEDDNSITNNTFKAIEDQIKELILHINDSDISKKLQAFEGFSNLFNDIYANIDFISKSTLKGIVNSHISNLSVSYYKLTLQVLKNLMKFIFYLDDIFTEENIFNIVKLVVINISSQNEIISQNSYSLYEIMRKKLNTNLLIKPLIEIVDIEIPLEILDISIDLISPLIELSVTSLSNQKYLNSFIYKLVKICLMNNENSDNNILDKIIDCFELIWKKFPKHLSQGLNSLDYELKQYITNLLEKYKKDIFNNLNLDNRIVESEECNDLLELYEKCNYDTFHNTIIKEGLLRSFLQSLKNIKNSQVNNIISLLKEAIYNNSLLFSDEFNLLLSMEIYILEKFPEYSDLSKNLIQVTINNFKKQFMNNISVFITNKQDTQMIITILYFIQNVIMVVDKNELLQSLPNFIDSIFYTINHTSSDVRKLSVYILVDIYYKLGIFFDNYLQKLNQSQRNLINIYVQKKMENL